MCWLDERELLLCIVAELSTVRAKDLLCSAMALEADAATDFAGKVRLPLPEEFKGDSALWEEWSRSFMNYI